ncbi:hypothetical protein [Thermobifida cellulosilytica]|uniref:Membrane fusogenic activity family protein n=1 Tax=Thermobifida cellulosilytica TB100 TaxID=665004 RepID=A0A147KD88_THECS|nr:hypothetical protein [Thermobifida cellulosilytica]KUP95261.1 hypothetical protein AC529_18560 [Thermobifida cellulosilytica TB100]
MVVDVVRAYLEAASGLTELTRKRAVAAAKTLIRESDERAASPRASDTAGGTENGESPLPGVRVGPSIQALAAELIETSRNNRAALGRLIEEEVARVLDRLDVVPRDDYDRLARRVAELERRLASVTAAQRRRTTVDDAARTAAAAPEQPVPQADTGDRAEAADEADTPTAGVPAADAPAQAAEPVPAAEADTQAGRTEESTAEEPQSQQPAEEAAPESTAKPAARSGKTKTSRARAAKSQTKRAATRRGTTRNGSKS